LSRSFFLWRFGKLRQTFPSYAHFRFAPDFPIPVQSFGMLFVVSYPHFLIFLWKFRIPPSIIEVLFSPLCFHCSWIPPCAETCRWNLGNKRSEPPPPCLLYPSPANCSLLLLCGAFVSLLPFAPPPSVLASLPLSNLVNSSPHLSRFSFKGFIRVLFSLWSPVFLYTSSKVKVFCFPSPLCAFWIGTFPIMIIFSTALSTDPHLMYQLDPFSPFNALGHYLSAFMYPPPRPRCFWKPPSVVFHTVLKCAFILDLPFPGSSA